MSQDHHRPMPLGLRRQIAERPLEERHTMEHVWDLLGRAERDALAVPDNEAAWADLQQRLKDAPAAAPITPRTTDRAPQQHRWRRMRWGAAGALGLVVLLVVGLVWWRLPVTVVVPPGAHRVVTLPDGSTVELNSASELRYTRHFQAWPFVPTRRRVVSLQGEAFFEVARAPRPFVVETFNARVEVLGTRFNVRARHGLLEEETRVTLAAGRVRVTAPREPNQPVLLSQAGQVARVTGDARRSAAAPASTEDLDRTLAWRQHGFAAVEQPLASILAEVERRYALSIEVRDGVPATDTMTLFYFHGTTPAQIIHDICLAQDCRYRKTSRGFVVYSVGASAPPHSSQEQP